LVIAGAIAAFFVVLGPPVEQLRSKFVNSPVSANYLTLSLGAVVASLVVGTWIAIRRPRAAVGWLLMVAALGTGVGYYRFSTHPWLAAAGLVVFYATSLLPLHAAVVSGEGVSRGASIVLRIATGALTLLGITIALTAPSGSLDRWFVAADPTRHVENMFARFDAAGVADAASVAWWCVLLAAAIVGTADRTRRWARAPGRVRRIEAPVVFGAIVWVALMAGAAATTLTERVPVARQVIDDFAAVALPAMALAILAAVIGWVELLEPRLARRDGAVDLRSIEPDRVALRSLLADLLATPRVDVAYDAAGVWVDVNGRPLNLDRDRRTHTVVRFDGEPVAAILHDRDVPVDAVQLGARLTAAQIAAERTAAVARARAEAVRAATAELVRAGDRAALAVATDMLAGPVPELDGLAHRLRTDPSAIAAAADDLRAVTAQVREISHGLLPRELAERGLTILGSKSAITRRLPSAIEVTVYLLACDDPDARVLDEGEAIVVHRRVAPGAESVARTTALGGRVDGTVATVPIG
jgi:hypothetical protein